MISRDQCIRKLDFGKVFNKLAVVERAKSIDRYDVRKELNFFNIVLYVEIGKRMCLIINNHFLF